MVIDGDTTSELMRRVATRVVTSLPANQKPSTLRRGRVQACDSSLLYALAFDGEERNDVGIPRLIEDNLAIRPRSVINESASLKRRIVRYSLDGANFSKVIKDERVQTQIGSNIYLKIQYLKDVLYLIITYYYYLYYYLFLKY